MVETAFHGPVEVCLFLFFYSDFVIVPGRGGGFFLFRIKFHHFSVPDRTITCASENFLSYFLRLLLLLFHVFVQNFLEFVQNRIFFVQRPEGIPACFFRLSVIFYPDCDVFLFFLLILSLEKSVFLNPTVRQ